jgi:flagellar protein FlbD
VIKVTRFNHSEVILNADLIEFIEATPDTVITMITGRKVLVRETADEVRSRALEYRRSLGPVIPRPALFELAGVEQEG